MEESIRKAGILLEALPYIQSFQKKIVVIKLGGSAMSSPKHVEGVLRDIVFMEAVKMKPILVHGGGNAITRRMKKEGISARFVEGLRVTDAKTIGIVREVLSGINAELAGMIEEMGGRASAMSAGENSVIRARKHRLPASAKAAGEDIGFVGEVDRVIEKDIRKLIGKDTVPVIAPLGQDERGRFYNINADIAAGEIAADLAAEKLVFLTDVAGIIRPDERGRETQPFSSLKRKEIESLLKEEVIGGGMIPKVRAGLNALEKGVEKIHIIDGRVPHSLLLEIFTDKGVGTEIVG